MLPLGTALSERLPLLLDKAAYCCLVLIEMGILVNPEVAVVAGDLLRLEGLHVVAHGEGQPSGTEQGRQGSTPGQVSEQHRQFVIIYVWLVFGTHFA